MPFSAEAHDAAAPGAKDQAFLSLRGGYDTQETEETSATEAADSAAAATPFLTVRVPADLASRFALPVLDYALDQLPFGLGAQLENESNFFGLKVDSSLMLTWADPAPRESTLGSIESLMAAYEGTDSGAPSTLNAVLDWSGGAIEAFASAGFGFVADSPSAVTPVWNVMAQADYSLSALLRLSAGYRYLNAPAPELPDSLGFRASQQGGDDSHGGMHRLYVTGTLNF